MAMHSFDLSPIVAALSNIESPVSDEARKAMAANLAHALSEQPKWQPSREATDLFEPIEVSVSSFDELQTAISTLERKNGRLGLVWRGQTDHTWAVASSLTRSLIDSNEFSPTGVSMSAIEDLQDAATRHWGLPLLPGLLASADRQHFGAPSRLIDVTMDPLVAAYFATDRPAAESKDGGRIIAWTRSPRNKNQPIAIPSFVVDPMEFWDPSSDQTRLIAPRWSSGENLPLWLPPAQNERMRAQRAGFLVDSEPQASAATLQLLEKTTGKSWRREDVTQATRIVGAPSNHDKAVQPNPAGIVALFTIKIEEQAKEDIQDRLRDKNIHESTIYPDHQGLMENLKRQGADILRDG